MLKYNEQLQHELYNTLDFDIKIDHYNTVK